MRETLILLAAILAIPIALLALRALMGWRYARMLRRAMRADSTGAPELGSDSNETVRESARPRLTIADLSATPLDASPAATALVAEALARTGRLRRAFALSVGVYAAIVSATVSASFSASIPTDGRFVALYLLLGSLLILLTSALSLPFRWIGLIALAYVSLLLLSPLVAAPGRILALIRAEGAMFLVIPAVAALLASRSLRPVIAFGAAIALYVILSFGIAGLVNTSELAPSFGDVRPMVWVLGAVTLLASMFVVAWILNRPTPSRSVLALSAMTAAGAALSWFGPTAELLGAMIVGIGTNALQLLLIWLFFRIALRLQRLRWLSWQALQLHLALALLSVYLIALLLLAEGLFKREIWSGLAVAMAFVCYVAITHILLSSAVRHQRDWPARRLLFLRTFGSRFRSRRLLRALDDTWRRVGRVDLIGGVDIGIDSVDARMLHAFLIRRPDRLVVRSRDDETAAFKALRTELEGDVRYPVNDLVCAADCWQPVVTQLAARADVVLMDMRGFTRQNRGCIFELNTVMSHVPLPRLVIVIDGSTSRPALDDVVTVAWQQLPEVSTIAPAQAPTLGLLDFGARHAERRLFEFLAASASALSSNPAVAGRQPIVRC